MYEPAITAKIIKTAAKRKGIKVGEALEECGLNKNTLNSMSNRGSWIQSDSLAKIADCLECSTDYLLGREDEHGNKNFLWEYRKC